jgi:PKD repeat protein
MAYKKNDVNFTYSPTEPRAGEKVQFTNQSSSGEEWEWSFGDGSMATIKSPSHTYKQPGTYRVMLKVDKKNAWTATKELTVYDTVPTFTASDSVFYIYKDYTFTANVYNPYNYGVEYWWLGYESDKSTLTTYFTHPEETTIALIIVLNGDTTLVVKSFDI